MENFKQKPDELFKLRNLIDQIDQELIQILGEKKNNENRTQKLNLPKGIQTEIEKIMENIPSLFRSKLSERFEITQKVAEHKKSTQTKIIQNNRWSEVLQKIQNSAKIYNLSKEEITEIRNTIHNYSIQQQKNYASSPKISK